jgi:hypothetical protein
MFCQTDQIGHHLLCHRQPFRLFNRKCRGGTLSVKLVSNSENFLFFAAVFRGKITHDFWLEDVTQNWAARLFSVNEKHHFIQNIKP